MTIFGILLTVASLPDHVIPSTIARHAAVGIGISVFIGVFMDLRDGVRNLLRTDLLSLASFYFLTLVEFLFPQPYLDAQLDPEQTNEGLVVVWVAFVGMLIGRHLWKPKKQPFEEMLTHPFPTGKLVFLFWVSAFLGYFYMLEAVHFSLGDMIEAMIAPRFTQPWARGRLGDWHAFVSELNLLIQLLPPICGMVLARLEKYRPSQYLPIMAITAFSFFFAFTSGTRNLFASYLLTFAVGYALALPVAKRYRFVPMLAGCAVAMLLATWMMLNFRNVGFKNWVTGREVPAETESQHTLSVDYNLISISRIAHYFPKTHDYLGIEIPWMALIHPIPRALWPGKPIDMSVTIEDVFGMSGLTISATYAGETYMAGGISWVIIGSLFFGAVTGWWNYLASSRNSELGILVYSSGFFAAVISMRSLFVFTTALLPTIASLLAVRWLVIATTAGARKLAQLAKGRSGPPERRPPLPAAPARFRPTLPPPQA